jgi:DNA polymerase III subunit epsilon
LIDPVTSTTTRYQQLVERACRFIDEHHGAVHEDLLVRHVFGSTASPELWRSLLRQVLGEAENLALRVDGYWSIIGTNGDDRSATSLVSEAFTVIDVETTGLRPYQHRIIEFGAVRYRDGAPVDTLSILINPECRVPAYIRNLTGIDDSMLADAPLFAVASDTILEFIGDDPIIGYNTGFDMSFLNAELKRIDAEPLINEQIDLLPVASLMLTGTRARGLESLARELGITVKSSHRALDDALTTGQVLVRLAPSLRTAGFETLAGLGWVRRSPRDPGNQSEPVGRGRSILDARHVEFAPSAPGVYLMRSAGDRVIYVGKAKNLRSRIRSYYSQPLGYTRKMDGLLQSIDRIETIETGSELSALLLEAQLIRRYQPQFNRQLRTSESYPYIRVDITNPWPRVSLARESADDGALYYGPYRSSRAARATVDALNDIFPLRNCTRSFKSSKSYGSPCTALDLGQCLGPCTGTVDPGRYRGHILQVIEFLEGDIDPVLQRLHDQLEETAVKLDFERAARIRNRIERVSDLAQAQKVLSDADRTGQLAIVLPAPSGLDRELLLAYRGRPWARRIFHPEEPNEEVIRDLARSWNRAQRYARDGIAQHELDELQILARWVRSHWNHPSIIPLDSSGPDWPGVMRTARDVELIT